MVKKAFFTTLTIFIYMFDVRIFVHLRFHSTQKAIYSNFIAATTTNPPKHPFKTLLVLPIVFQPQAWRNRSQVTFEK